MSDALRDEAEAAWEAYRSLAEQILDQPRLLLDRRFNERLVLANHAWQVAFARFGETLGQPNAA